MMFLLLFIGQNAWGQSGTLDGTKISWSLSSTDGNQTYTLTITGSGDMPDWSPGGNPWWSYRSNITSINVDDAITKIGSYSFSETNITSFNIPSSCKSIEFRALCFCKELKEIYIPASVKYIGRDVCQGCENLNLIHYDARCTYSSGIACVFRGVAATGKIIEKEGAEKSYIQIPDGDWEYYTHGDKCSGGAWVAESGSKLFVYSKTPGAVVDFSDGIGDYSGANPWRVDCDKYTSLEINRNIASFGEEEFIVTHNSDVAKMGYTNIKTITIENGAGNNYFLVDRYGALYDKAKTTIYLYPAKSTATEIEIPASVKEIRPGAFYGASKLQKVTFLGAVETIGKYAFAQASSLNYIHFSTNTVPAYPVALDRKSSAFKGVASAGIVAADVKTNAEANAFMALTNSITGNWTFDGDTYGPVKAYISNGTLYVVGKGPYTIGASASNWYSDRNSITKIIVGENITNIGTHAFASCSNVTEVTLNNKGYVNYEAFYYCTSLTRINIGKGVTAFLHYYNEYKKWDYYPFYACPNLEYINIADFASFNAIEGLEYLTNGKYGTKDSKVLMVNGETHNSLYKLDVPKGVTKISNAAIRFFRNVTSIKIPETVTEIPFQNFYYCSYLTDIVVPQTVTNIGGEAFSGCDALTTVSLQNKGYINYSAFRNCSALTRVNIGRGVTGFYDFYNEYTGAHSYPFEGCSNLEYINIDNFASFNAIENLNFLTDSKCGTKEGKKLLLNSVQYTSTHEWEIPEGVTKINADAIRYFNNVCKIKIPSTVTAITNYNFENCKKLTEITLPPTVTSVGYHAFEYCTGLKTVTLNNTGYINYSAFRNCSALTRVNIGTGVTGFYDLYNEYTGAHSYPFKGCSNLSIINITDFASFNAIKNLEYLTDSSYGTVAEKSLYVDGKWYDWNDTFYIPEGITSYNSYALKYFHNVKKICLPSTMTTVSGFKNHRYLTNVTLPLSVTSVEKNAFYGCSALERIVCLAGNVPSATGAIASNPGDITLRVTYASYSDYKAANYWKDFNIERGDLNRWAGTQTLKTLTSRDLNDYILESAKVVSWTSSNTNNVSVNNGVISSCDFKYDGSTINPFRSASISAITENANTYSFSVRVEPREVVLTDGKAYKNTVDFEAENISYTRTFAEKYVDHLQCFYVPFDVEVTDDLLDDYTFYKLYMVSQEDKNGNGLIEEDEPLVMLLNRVPAGQVMKANMPYYIKPKAATTLTVTAQNATLYAAANGTVSCATTENEYTLTGIYDTTNIKGRYTMSAKGNFSYYTKDTNLGSYRWYMTVRDRMANGAELENYAHPIQILIEGEDDTTGIIALQDKTSAPQNDKVYTLDGRQVNNTNNLPSGIYIINGKKVFKK